jgi:hypothetical protein
MKKTLIIVGIVILIGVAGYLAWKFLVPQNTAESPTPTGTESSLALPKNLSRVVDRSVSHVWASEAGDLFYATSEGTIFTRSAAGSESLISDEQSSPITAVFPSLDEKNILVAFGAGEERFWSILNNETKSWQPLPERVITAGWSPSGNQIAMLVEKGGTSSLDILNIQNKKVTTVLPSIAIKGVDLSWPLPGEIYLSEKPLAQSRSSIIGIDINKKTVRVVADNEMGLMVRWSPDGKTGIKLADGFLTLIDSSSRVLKIAPFGATIPSKCALSGAKIYCAVPVNIPNQSKFLDDYFMSKFLSRDIIVEWDTANDTIREILGESFPFDAKNLAVNEKKIIFLNSYDEKVYEYQLTEASGS